ncbi:5-oxoprolinase [Skermanella aerolata]|uniref:5-oxoprolinase n=1 Tax=Skermanella aerolata TaxID=393310 RepID=A0A512DU53_9PROT|nr:hydantoinase B/oxoprolinase family protein [Skermanella aerolata]KJB92405.1 hydantoinase [Skermanella aerolata KACC 11604]GEO39995.1 5-oxoprolinase [Skermanella aerolata]
MKSESLDDKKQAAGMTRTGVRMAIISNRMESIARKMQNTLFRTARSGVLNTAHDFSCVILTADCELLASAESLPIHTLIGPDLMCQAVRKYHPEMKAGDCFLHNSPYEGDSHAADHCLIVPVVDEDGVVRFFVLAKAHQADCGNSKPTTYMGQAADVYEEGALIFSAAKIQSEYKDNQDLIRMCRTRIRVPEQWWGDYLATLGAVRIGERELLQLGREVGWEALEDYADGWFDYSEQKMIQAIQRLPSGKATVHSAHDPLPGVPDGIPVKVTVNVDSVEGRISVDLRDNVDCQPCGLNLSEGCARTAAMIGIYNGLIDHGVPPNAGSFRRIQVDLRENCVVGIPRHPYSCSVATTNLADRVSTPVQRAIAEIAPGFGMAETGPIMPPAMGVISGRDPRTGEAFVNQIFLGITGGAGTPVTDGFLTIIHAGNAGLCRQDSIEVDELHHPLFVSERRLIPDTEGAGKFRGAPSIYAEFGPIEDCTMQVIYTADGTVNPALGARSGGPGGNSKAFKRELDGTLTSLPACHGAMLEPGEFIVSHSAGGGGYGSPVERDPERVLSDLREGLITAERARTVYGLVTTGADAVGPLAVDRSATQAMRASLKAQERSA